MKAYLVVASVTLGEVSHPSLYFIAWWNSLFWMRGLENLGTFEGNKWQQRLFKTLLGHIQQEQRINTHLPITKAIYIHDPQTTSQQYVHQCGSSRWKPKIFETTTWSWMVQFETKSKPNLKSKVDDPSLRDTSLSFCLPPIGEYAKSYVGNHFPNNVKPQQKIFNHRLEIPILYTPEISPYLNIFERRYLF